MDPPVRLLRITLIILYKCGHSRLKTASLAAQSENLQNHHDVLKCKYSGLCTKSEPDCKTSLKLSSFTASVGSSPTL